MLNKKELSASLRNTAWILFPIVLISFPLFIISSVLDLIADYEEA